jgi:hypothetical protein
VPSFNRQSQIVNPPAQRWFAAVNADASFTHWFYRIVDRITDISSVLSTF